MSTDYRHRGCSTPVLRFLPAERMTAGRAILSKEWLVLPQGTKPQKTDSFPDCPDCGARVGFSPKVLEEVH